MCGYQMDVHVQSISMQLAVMGAGMREVWGGGGGMSIIV